MKKAFLLSMLVLLLGFVTLPVVTASPTFSDHQQTTLAAGDLAAGSVQAYITDQVMGIEAPAIQVSDSQINGSPPLGNLLDLSTVIGNTLETMASPNYSLRQLRQTLDNGLSFRAQEVAPWLDKLRGAQAVA